MGSSFPAQADQIYEEYHPESSNSSESLLRSQDEYPDASDAPAAPQDHSPQFPEVTLIILVTADGKSLSLTWHI